MALVPPLVLTPMTSIAYSALNEGKPILLKTIRVHYHPMYIKVCNTSYM